MCVLVDFLCIGEMPVTFLSTQLLLLSDFYVDLANYPLVTPQFNESDA